MKDYRDTLVFPFDQGTLPLPQQGEKWAFLNAEVLPNQAELFGQTLLCEQGARPNFLKLDMAGFSTEPLIELGENLDACLVLASRVRAVNEYNLTRAWNAVKPGGMVVYSGDKKLGAQAVRKWFAGKIPLGGSQSKNHAVVFWSYKEGVDWPLPELTTAGGDFHVAAGMFSASGPDAGSRILAEHFDKRIFGRVADFGAGWGYLSNQLLQRCDRIEKLELFESDWASLEAAKKNVGKSARYHWADLTSEAPKGPFDWIIMNPPFHQGRAAEPELGVQFIQAAARALPAGGRLLMVANTNLPYERPLEQIFKKVDRLEQRDGFKIIEAVRGGR